MLNKPLRLGVRHRALVIGFWQRLTPTALSLFMAGLIVSLIIAYAG